MTEKEITKALRWFAKVTTHCEHNIVSCPECEFHGFCTDPYSDDGICKMHECLTAAADTITRLTAELAALKEAHNELRQVREQLAAEQVTSQSLRNAANGYKAQLDAEKRRADAAVDDMRRVGRHIGVCCACKYTRDSWRGAKGERE